MIIVGWPVGYSNVNISTGRKTEVLTKKEYNMTKFALMCPGCDYLVQTAHPEHYPLGTAQQMLPKSPPVGLGS